MKYNTVKIQINDTMWEDGFNEEFIEENEQENITMAKTLVSYNKIFVQYENNREYITKKENMTGIITRINKLTPNLKIRELAIKMVEARFD